MAPTKRKRNSIRSAPNKRPKSDQESGNQHDADENPIYHKAHCILRERFHRGELQYQIKWEGTDSNTGKAWEHTWEPSENANEALVATWKEEKAQRITDSTGGRAVIRRPRGVLKRQQTGQRPVRRKPESYVIDSSPQPSTAQSSTLRSEPSTPARDSSVLIAGSSTSTTPIATPAHSPRLSPRVQIAARGSSYERDEFERISQLAASQFTSTQSHTQVTDLDSSQIFTATGPFSSGIVPDSQSSAGEASFIPATQQTTDTNQGSSVANDSQYEEEITKDTGLLEIIQEATSRAVSPVISIPETIPDIVTHSQSQNQSVDVQNLGEVPDTFDTVDQSVAQQYGESGAPDLTGVGVVDWLITPVHASKVPAQAGEKSIDIPASSHIAPLQLEQRKAEPSSRGQGQEGSILNESLGPGYCRSHSPIGEDQVTDTIPQSVDTSTTDTEEEIQRSDFGPNSQITRSTAQSAESREQNAQAVPTEVDLSTQEDITETIRPTVEEEYVSHCASLELRHDSSQETPEPQSRSAQNSFSPIPPPPSHSLGTQDSKLPPRPTTPVLTSSLSIMANHDTGDEVARLLKEGLAKRQTENPYTPSRRIARSSFTPSIATPAQAPVSEDLVSSLTSARRLLRTNASPSAVDLEGTRSPSSITDRSPAPQAPTSLRTVAFAPNNSVHAAPSNNADVATSTGGRPGSAEIEVIVVTNDEGSTLDGPSATDPEDNELSDVDDDDSESLLNDDLNLEREEYIVPLFIEGRQWDAYTEYIQQKKDLLDQFVKDPRGFSPLSKVEEVLSYLRAIETHIDLVFAETENSSWVDMNSASQTEFAAQFGMENSTKFRFLHSLFHHLRDHDKHIVLVTEKDNDSLFSILETFCRAKSVNYSMPTKGRQADPAHTEGTLFVTILPGNASPIIRAPDLIICLDGVQQATQLRQNNWAQPIGQDLVPVLHLVIPRAVGHIERYISPALDVRERIHTTLLSLAQMRGELGKPMDGDTPRAPIAAAQVVDWLTTDNDDNGLSWPLPSIGSVKDVIEYQTQMSQTSQRSSTPPAPERTKRPLDDEDLDPAKRMRFTPQPQTVTGSSMTNIENEATHISDSIPGTAADIANLRRQLARTEEAYEKERAGRKAEEQRFRDHEVLWDKQQTVHEDLTREYRLLLGQQKVVEEKLESMTKNNETLRERLVAKTAEIRQLTNQLEEQRTTHLLSDDAKIGEITRLRKELATALEDKERAVKSKKTSDSMLDYTKEQYRNAQDSATSSQATIDQLTEENAKLSHAASGQPAILKGLHLERQYENQDKQLKSLRAESTILKRTLWQKDEELQRARNVGRMGVGTRAQSATPQPKVRSRAASPMGGRLSNLRNG
ncbi:hypothetical protein BKA66DRAFT_454590 [Pyrenochaeta sp. MPI-SDFR-AT-0127]|nr:hypothetical protein BKA66DRAFT_454590 [Pyrenochaeta sp. MPI-SDFR-AT-0127]